MQWEQVRNIYPNTWVLFEAIEAHSYNGKRVVEDIAILNTFSTGNEAMRRYLDMHRQNPDRELFIFNTVHEKLDIKEKLWMGVRG